MRLRAAPRWVIVAIVVLLTVRGMVADDWKNTSRDHLSIHNDDIEWQFSTFGLLPLIRGSSREVLSGKTEVTRAALLNALSDPERAAAAHVILTLKSRQSINRADGTWNGLVIEKTDDGRIMYSSVNFRQLEEQWRHKVSRHSRDKAKWFRSPSNGGRWHWR